MLGSKSTLSNDLNVREELYYYTGKRKNFNQYNVMMLYNMICFETSFVKNKVMSMNLAVTLM